MGRGYLHLTIETTNRDFYDYIRVQEFIFLPEDLVEAFGQINTFFANHENIVISFSIVAEELNRTTEYLARYGLENMDSFAEAPLMFSNLQFFLDRDMGVVFPYPEMDLLPNLGQGEVVDGEPPSPVLSDIDFQEEILGMDIEIFNNEDFDLAPVPVAEAFPAILDPVPVDAPVTHIHVEVFLNINVNITGCTATQEEISDRKSK